jgi:hypothetical protein
VTRVAHPFRQASLLATLLLTGLAAGDAAPPAGVLAGADRLWVRASVLSEPAKEAGLDDETFVISLSGRVSRAGWLVLAVEDPSAAEWPYLWLTLQSIEPVAGVVVYNATLELRETVSPERRPEERVSSPTWMTGRMGWCEDPAYPDEARRVADELVDEFLADAGPPTP